FIIVITDRTIHTNTPNYKKRLFSQSQNIKKTTSLSYEYNVPIFTYIVSYLNI
ncbi:MAG: hypothetical protein Q621_VSBC00066G0001, partial [Veillonella sp. DORA_B_18_19_23]